MLREEMGVEPCEIARRFFEELWNGRRFELAAEIVSPDCVTHQLRSGDEPPAAAPRGPEALVEHIRSWLEAFPDLHFTVEESVSEGDRVVSWVAMRGTHLGPWLGVPPTGEPVAMRCAVMHRVTGGRIVEDWALVESLGLFQQLGLVESPETLLAEASARRATTVLSRS
jgi:predicted ester cyclase